MDLETIKEITSSSNTIVTWSMSIVGASLLAILSTSYIKPVEKWNKLAYLLYIPGWVYLAIAIQLGNKIARREIVAVMAPERIPGILEKMNDEYASQLQAFNMSLIFWGIWLLLFLLWWIFQDFFASKKESPGQDRDQWVS